MMEPPTPDVSTSSTSAATAGETADTALQSAVESSSNLQVSEGKGLSAQRQGSDLDDLLKQHTEIIDWNAAVETAIIENPSLLKTDVDTSEVAKKASASPVIEFRPPFCAFVNGISFQAKREDIYYFFGGPKNVEDVHVYINPPNGNPPNKFSGDAMLLLKSLDALIEVLKMDGEDLFMRSVNVYHVIQGSREKKRYSRLQLENVRLAPSIPPVQHNERGHHRQDNRGGHMHGDTFTSRQSNQPSGRNAYSQPQQQQRNNMREKFMPRKESNDVRSFQQHSQPNYSQPHHHPQSRQSMPAYSAQSGHRVPPAGQPWTENAEIESKEKPTPVQRQTSMDIFGTKPVDTAKKLAEIEKKMESEEKVRTSRDSESSVHHQAPQYRERRSGENQQPGGYRMASNSSSMQSLSQPLQGKVQYNAILKNTNNQYSQRKQSVESANYPVPLNQCHPTARGSSQHLDNEPAQQRTDVVESNQWDNSMANEVLNETQPGQVHTDDGPKRQISRNARSGSESSANNPQGQHHRPYNPKYNKQMSRESTGGHPRSQQQYTQSRYKSFDNRGGREEKGGRANKYTEVHRVDHPENKSSRDEERHQHQQYRQKTFQKSSRESSPPRLNKSCIKNIQDIIQKSSEDKAQHHNSKDTQNHDHQTPLGQNTAPNYRRPLTFHRHNKNKEGTHKPGNVRKKQSMDSKLDDTARDDQNKESSHAPRHTRQSGRSIGQRQIRSDSSPSNIDSPQKDTQDNFKDNCQDSSKEVTEQPPPDPVSSTPRASVGHVEQSKSDNAETPQKNPGTPPSQGGSTKKKENKRKSKKDSGNSSVTTKNKFTVLSDVKEY